MQFVRDLLKLRGSHSRYWALIMVMLGGAWVPTLVFPLLFTGVAVWRFRREEA
jgi:hypothetical protein